MCWAVLSVGSLAAGGPAAAAAPEVYPVPADGVFAPGRAGGTAAG